MADKTDYIEVELIVPAKDFIKETEKAYCFKLWGKKFLAVPKSVAKNVGQSGSQWVMTVCKWFVDKHSLRSLVHEDFKHLFPTKTELKKQAAEGYVPPLFKSPEVAEAYSPSKKAFSVEFEGKFPPEFRDTPSTAKPKPFAGTTVDMDEDLSFD